MRVRGSRCGARVHPGRWADTAWRVAQKHVQVTERCREIQLTGGYHVHSGHKTMRIWGSTRDSGRPLFPRALTTTSLRALSPAVCMWGSHVAGREYYCAGPERSASRRRPGVERRRARRRGMQATKLRASSRPIAQRGPDPDGVHTPRSRTQSECQIARMGLGLLPNASTPCGGCAPKRRTNHIHADDRTALSKPAPAPCAMLPRRPR